MIFSWVGALASSFSGVGPGLIFIPGLVFIGIDVHFSTGTGMYIALLSCLSAKIQAIFLKKINLLYAFYILCMTVIGTFPGLHL
jgi:uncharacterized membrane protein YfcA